MQQSNQDRSIRQYSYPMNMCNPESSVAYKIHMADFPGVKRIQALLVSCYFFKKLCQ